MRVFGCLLAPLLVVLVASVSRGGLSISYPTSGMEILIGTSFNVSGSGGIYNMSNTKVITAKCWKNDSEVGNPPACSASCFPGSDTLWSTPTMGYGGEPDDSGYILVEQEGNDEDNVYVKWKRP